MCRRIYICRHGQTIWNGENRKQGHLDSPLSKIGIKHAQLVASYLQQENVIGTLYSSPLGRALASASVVLKHNNGMKLKIDARLKEMSFGILQGLTQTAINKRYGHILKQFYENPFDYNFPAGESYGNLACRATCFIEEIFTENNREDSVIMAHEDINRILVRNILKLNMRKDMMVSQPHTVIIKIHGNSFESVRLENNEQCFT